MFFDNLMLLEVLQFYSKMKSHSKTFFEAEIRVELFISFNISVYITIYNAS